MEAFNYKHGGKVKNLFVLILLALISACGTMDVPQKSTSSFEHSFAWNNPAWDKTLIKAIETDSRGLVNFKPKDWNDYIDVWPATFHGRVKFWGNILVTMARFESGFIPNKQYTEDFVDAKKNNVISRGLFQISIESANNRNRGNCGFTHYSQINDPIKNINCAVKIFSYFATSDGYIRKKITSKVWKGPARYWSVIRGVSNKNTRKAWAEIKKANR